MAVWFSGMRFVSWKLLEPFRELLVVSPRFARRRPVPPPQSTDEGDTSPVRGSDPLHDVHRLGGQRWP